MSETTSISDLGEGVYASLADFYNRTIPDLLEGDSFYSTPRGKPCYEFLAVRNMFPDPTRCVYENQVRPYQWRYLAGELNWYLDGDPDVSGILPYSRFWGSITNPDDRTVNSNYGNLLFNRAGADGECQWLWAFNKLTSDPDTRQAIMYLGGPDFQFSTNRDFVCTSTIQYFIRDGYLHCVVNQRSCDLNFGLPYDLPWFSILQQNMLILVNSELGEEFELGALVHMIGSMHVYEHNEERLSEATESGFRDPGQLELVAPLVDQFGMRFDLQPELDPVHELIMSETNPFQSKEE